MADRAAPNRRKLTEVLVEKIRPGGDRYEVWDSVLPGFGLRVSPKGTKTFVLMYRFGGVLRRQTIGRYPLFGLAVARDAARSLLQEVALRRDPRLREPAPLRSPAFDDVLAQFIERHARRNTRSWRETERILKANLLPFWSGRSIDSIARRDVIEVLDRMVDRGAAVSANRLLAHSRRLFGWAIERGLIGASPFTGVKSPAKEVSRDRVLDDHELIAIWNACEDLGWPFGPFVRLLIATAQRRDEVAHMAWADLDLEARSWVIPRELTKADRAHEVPLSRLAIEMVEGAPKIGVSDLLFPAKADQTGTPSQVRAISGFSKAKLRLDRFSGVEGWRMHDLRRTAASGMARMGHPPHVVAAVLNHAPGGTQGITSVYNRHRYGDEKRAALEAWGRHVDRLIQTVESEVINFR